MLNSESWSFRGFQHGETPLPDPNLGWHLYGVGLENMGSDGMPEEISLPETAPNQLLVRVDAVGLCFSDVKLVNLGGGHPKLFGRDLSAEPTRLGHEATVTVVEVGRDLETTYSRGDRLAIQPDIHIQGRSTAYGYTISGALIQYHHLGPEVLDVDGSSYAIQVDRNLGYAAAALSEPWACVHAAYTQRRRLEPLENGRMWIIGHQDDDREYSFSVGLDKPSAIVLTNVSEHVRALVETRRSSGSIVIERDGIRPEDYGELSAGCTDGHGFDDIVLLNPGSAEQVSRAALEIAFRGTMNLVGEQPLEEVPMVDVGRIHYDYTAYVGCSGPEISAAYGREENRCDLRPGGVAVFFGAAGPMGQMHMQRAIESAEGPRMVIGIDRDEERLAAAETKLSAIAEQNDCDLHLESSSAAISSGSIVSRLTDGIGADDVVVLVPSGEAMAEAARLMAPGGMLVLFAGVPNGTMAPLDLSRTYLDNTQFTGTSGSNLADQEAVLSRAADGLLSPERSVGAVGGIEAALDGVRAMIEGRYAGKVLIFPQLTGLPLTGLDELRDQIPEVGEQLGDGDVWTARAERALIENFKVS